jgi:hypothetical protein
MEERLMGKGKRIEIPVDVVALSQEELSQFVGPNGRAKTVRLRPRGSRARGRKVMRVLRRVKKDLSTLGYTPVIAMRTSMAPRRRTSKAG